MDQTTITLMLSLLSAVGGALVGRSTILKQIAEAKKEQANAGFISVQTFNLLRTQVEDMQKSLMTLQQDKESLQAEIETLKESNRTKDARIAELERKLKNFMDPKPKPRRRQHDPRM